MDLLNIGNVPCNHSLLLFIIIIYYFYYLLFYYYYYSIQGEIKCRLKAGNSCYYSVKTLLSSRLLFKNLKIKIYKTIILPVVLYGCETWFLILREECSLRLFENRIRGEFLGPRGMRMGSGVVFTMGTS